MAQLRSVTCHMGSHSVTCYPTQVNTPRLNPSQAGRFSIYLPRRDGRLSWPSWLDSTPAGSRWCQDVEDLLYNLYKKSATNPRQIEVMEFGPKVLRVIANGRWRSIGWATIISRKACPVTTLIAPMFPTLGSHSATKLYSRSYPPSSRQPPASPHRPAHAGIFTADS